MKNAKDKSASNTPAYPPELTELWPQEQLPQIVPLLQALHILTRDAVLNADSRRKLKQVAHLYHQLLPSFELAYQHSPNPVFVDCGAGKSYLGFILYSLLMAPRGAGELIAIETRADLCSKAEALAAQCGFDRMRFICAPVAEVKLTSAVDVVTALHACDTATDEALSFALAHQARVVALVPCCQAEIARQLATLKNTALQHLWRHPIQRREFGSQITNVIRALFLESRGYKMRVTELVGWEHAMKNELIVGEKIQGQNSKAAHELQALLTAIPVRPSQLPF